MEHLKFENTKVYNFEGAFRGMRNPKNSWHLSDSKFGVTDSTKELTLFTNEVTISYVDPTDIENYETKNTYLRNNGITAINSCWKYDLIGAKDMNLAQRLISGGSEHRKFLRQIQVCVDITAPLFWWKEFDTYKVGTAANSTSTMHKLAETPITRDCFLIKNESDNLLIRGDVTSCTLDSFINNIILICERLRKEYLETKDVRYWRALIELLPESWCQTRTVTMNYENLLSICKQRRNHKLPEWREDFISWARELPYAQDLIFLDELLKDKNS